MRLAHDGSLHTIALIPRSVGHSNDPIAYLLSCCRNTTCLVGGQFTYGQG
jgi:hypothetical protein